MLKRRLSMMVVLPALAACGGGEEDFSAGFQTRANAAQAIYDQTSLMNPTDPGAMPGSGSATYTGVASAVATLPEGDNEALYADVAMSADFAADTVSGTLSNWYGATIGPVTGTVTLSDGSITGAEWDANASGALTADGETGTVAMTMEGDFLGADAGGLDGTFSGSVTYVGAPTGSIIGAVDAVRD